MPQIILENITKTFDNDKVVAVSDVNLTIHDGDFVFLLGPSGCGKTTLLRTISGLLSPSKGKVFIDGEDVTDKPPQDREIAFVFQDFNIFPISVFENCTYALNVQGYGREYIIKQGEHALKIVGLEERADEIPIGWSNGDLQRLGLARAICSGAKILIMDEPLGSLDPKISSEFRWELRNIIKDQNLTAIQVTHNQEEAMAIGDYIIIMRDGKLLQQDKQQKLYNYPNSLFVGNFLGGLNILEAYIIHVTLPNKFNVNVRLGGPKFEIKSNFRKFRINENVILAFRPENVYLFAEDYNFKKSRSNWKGITLSSARVVEKYLSGKERRFLVELDNGDSIEISKPEVFIYDFKIGEKVNIGIFSDDIRMFKYPTNLEKAMDLQ